MRDDGRGGRIFRYGLGAAVAIAWLACIAAQIVSRGMFETPLAVHGLMGTVVGSMFGDIALQRAKQREGDNDG